MAYTLQICAAPIIFLFAVFAFPGTASAKELVEFCDLYRQILDLETGPETISDDEIYNCDLKTRIAIKHALGMSVVRSEYVNAGNPADIFVITNVSGTFGEEYYYAGFMLTEIALPELRIRFEKDRDEKRIEVYFYEFYKLRSKFIRSLSDSKKVISRFDSITKGMEGRVERAFGFPGGRGGRIADCFRKFDNFQVNDDVIASSAAFKNCMK